ncbi:MAG TPA: MaoC/PaaZ C-terminal domain-containing protein [Polyangiaceae bacterium]
MQVSTRHVLQHGPVIAALGRTAALALKQRVQGVTPSGGPVPGPEIHRSRDPLPRDLVSDYVRYMGGDPRAYRGALPPHLFPAWCMPAFARTLEGLPYPLLRVVNGGCKVVVQGRLPDNEPLEVRAHLQKIDDDGRRAVLEQHVTTGTKSSPEALVIDFYSIVPLSKSGNGGSKKSAPEAKKEKARVPEGAREIQRTRLRRDAGLAFAKLTGDFNPIHWVAPYARASGFKNVILHGFGSLGLCWEALNKNLFGGDVDAISSFDARLSRPLVLPHEVGVYVLGKDVFVGDAPGGPAYLVGSFTAKGEP